MNNLESLIFKEFGETDRRVVSRAIQQGYEMADQVVEGSPYLLRKNQKMSRGLLRYFMVNNSVAIAADNGLFSPHIESEWKHVSPALQRLYLNAGAVSLQLQHANSISDDHFGNALIPKIGKTREEGILRNEQMIQDCFPFYDAICSGEASTSPGRFEAYLIHGDQSFQFLRIALIDSLEDEASYRYLSKDLRHMASDQSHVCEVVEEFRPEILEKSMDEFHNSSSAE